jgi:hypothetical protein
MSVRKALAIGAALTLIVAVSSALARGAATPARRPATVHLNLGVRVDAGPLGHFSTEGRGR